MNTNPAKLSCNGLDSKIYIPVIEILVIEASGNHSYIHTTKDEKIFVTNSLKELTDRLKTYHFCRAHRQYLINSNKLYKLHSIDGGYIEMENGQKYPVSKPGKRMLMDALKAITI
ncbi:MAG: LytTR family transcriptional regulator [Saprospiraceae bacterium]|jgi:two-component system, LytTR family, response regulator|nr:LytTR family transcriptional regulator [Saprospiraceae bacterium]